MSFTYRQIVYARFIRRQKMAQHQQRSNNMVLNVDTRDRTNKFLCFIKGWLSQVKSASIFCCGIK